ncbi:toprim domain-containing protein [Methylobacterium sp. GC_Met_2]|uniref:DUF7146 domain-containing protein n=1 Tax=Methylobacterium sp. GC_Met_2 TaxID=2937376 RepID=UPI00226B88FD|nr:toprim domain-containing protein [Methylobacterium sp. GC_Met_2]
MMDLRTAARLLGGKISGRGINCPGRGHSARDESISVMFSPSAPDGVLVFDHAGGDHLGAKDYVLERLGRDRRSEPRATFEPRPTTRPEAVGSTTPSSSERAAAALRMWSEAAPPWGTPVATYLPRRRLTLSDDAAEVMRFHSNIPFAGRYVPAMIALVRGIASDAPQAIHRTALSLDGNKVEVNGKDRLALGPLAGGAVKLTADAEVTTCLGIGEGIETTLSLQGLPEFGATPVWSLLNASGIAAFPVLAGIECLWIAVDHDPAGERAADACTERWRAAGREVFRVKARAAGSDLNDLQEARRA